MTKKFLSKESIEEMIDERIQEMIDSGHLAKGPGPIPSGIITVTGGMLTEETIERLKYFMDESVKNPDMSKILILEVDPDLFGTETPETSINWIPLDKGKLPPIIQIKEDGLTGKVISGDIDEIREMLKRSGSLLEIKDGH